MADNLNYYELLQVDPQASRDDIQAAYERLAEKFYVDLTDRNKSPIAALIRQQLNAAYETLHDPGRRAEYDRALAAAKGKPTLAAVERGGSNTKIASSPASVVFRGNKARERLREPGSKHEIGHLPPVHIAPARWSSRGWSRMAIALFAGTIVISLFLLVIRPFITSPISPAEQARSSATLAFTSQAKATVASPPSIATFYPIKAGIVWRLVDDFASNRNGWPEMAGKTYFDASGFHINETEAENSLWPVCNNCGMFTDFVYEVELTKVQGPEDYGYGILFRQTDPDNFYTLQVAGNGSFRFAKMVGKTFRDLTGWIASDAISRGNGTNRLRVVADKARFDFYINDRLMGSVMDSTFSSGDVGVGVSKGGLHITVSFARVGSISSDSLVPTALTLLPTPTKGAASWLVLNVDSGKNVLRVSDSQTGERIAAIALDQPADSLAEGEVSSAVWSPDSDSNPTILVSSNRWAKIGYWAGKDLTLYDQSGKLQTTAIGNQAAATILLQSSNAFQVPGALAPGASLNSISDAIFAPGGSRIAVLVKELNADRCPVIMNRDGTGLRKLIQCDPYDHPRYWSVDGQWLVAWSEHSPELFAYQVDGERRVPLSQLGKIRLYDERYRPWRVLDTPVCESNAGFWGCR